MARIPTEASLKEKMDEAKRIGREKFLKKYAGGHGSDNWYVEVDGVHYDVKALWAAGHRPPIKTTSFQTYAAVAQLKRLNFDCVSGISSPEGLPGDRGYRGFSIPVAAVAPDDHLIQPVRPPVSVPANKKLKPTGYWLFLANPARWKGEEWRSSGQRELRYLVSLDDRRLMQAGDLGLIRLNKVGGKPARFLAAVEVLEAPSLMPELDPRFFTNPAEAAPALRTSLAVISSLEAAPVDSSSLPDEAAFKYMHEGIRRTTIPIERTAFLAVAKAMGVDGATLAALRESRTPQGVHEVERNLGELTPIQKERVVKFIERGPVGTAVKAAREGKCQVCEALGLEPVAFFKPGGEPYSEAHHVVPVSKLQPGSLHYQNIMVLCANHHRQAHYGSFDVHDRADCWILIVDGKRLRVEKTIVPA